jgi:endonuclease/exonuclease/phosphatase family metal-dependent hydrolase
MKKGYSIAFIIMFFSSLSAQSVRVMTFNIRYDTPRDSSNGWAYRRDKLCSIIPFYGIDICGMQEVLAGQLEDIRSRLPAYQALGVGRTDGKTGGEYSPILYDPAKLTLLESATFWLSETPDTPSIGWDAALPRIVTWAKFKMKKGGKKIYFFNTHFDHIGVKARAESARLILKKIKEIARNQDVILTGDFNSMPSEEPIQVLIGSSTAWRVYDTEPLSIIPHFGNYSSFTAFEPRERPDAHIDYIFISTPRIRVLRHGTLSHSFDGHFVSDHHPVMADLKW